MFTPFVTTTTRVRTFWQGSLCAAVLAGAALAQQPPAAVKEQPQPPPLVLKSTTRLVQVSVIATRKGQPVADLTKDHFTVTDNGKPQKLGLFLVESSGSLPRSPIQLPPNTFTNRLEQRAGTAAGITIILFDAMNTHFQDQAYAKAQIVKYLKTIQPDDRVGLYVLGGGLRVLHDYTTDSRGLLAKLAAYRGDNLPDVSDSEPKGLGEDTLQLDNWLAGRGGASGIERDFYMVNRVNGTLRAIQFIADHLSRVPGRKNLIWVSGGFPLTIGLDNLNEFGDPNREHRTFGDEITQCVRALNNANLSIYPVDARGLMVDSRFSAANRNADFTQVRPPPGSKNQETMEELASRTGGRAYYNTNDLSKAIREAVSDTKVVYTLGYYSSEEKFDGKFHNIKVKVSDSGVSLRYRKGYFDLPEQPQDDNARKTELRDAVFSPLDATEIGMAVQLQKGDAAKPDSMVFILQTDPRGLNLQQQGDRWVGKFDILWVQKDAQGRQYNGEDDTVEMRLTQQNYVRMYREGILYRRTITRAPRATTLRVVVRDASSGSIGSVTVPFSQLVKQ